MPLCLCFKFPLAGCISIMASTRNWYFLSWNIRGINSQAKWHNIRDKIREGSPCIVSLQETKKKIFDDNYIKKFCPRHLDKFAFSPSRGASGGLITIWNGQLFSGVTILINQFSITMKFTSLVDGKIFHTNIYGPSAPDEKANFINWLYNFDCSAIQD